MPDAPHTLTLQVSLEGGAMADLIALADGIDTLCRLLPAWDSEVIEVRDQIRARLNALMKQVKPKMDPLERIWRNDPNGWLWGKNYMDACGRGWNPPQPTWPNGVELHA